MTKSGDSARTSSAAERNVGTPHSAVIASPRSAERVTTPATRKRSGAARAMRRKNSERQPLPMIPNAELIDVQYRRLDQTASTDASIVTRAARPRHRDAVVAVADRVDLADRDDRDRRQRRAALLGDPQPLPARGA